MEGGREGEKKGKRAERKDGREGEREAEIYKEILLSSRTRDTKSRCLSESSQSQQ